ncbi:MAG: hypothetical protein L7U87_08190 [Chlamydiales bacterium]|nr:hypothetical protein [Chlamydiales bacterium]
MAGALYFIGVGEAKDVGVGAIKALSSLYKRAKFVKKEIQAVNLTGAKGVKHAERYFNISSSNPAQNANAQIALGKKLSALQGAQKDAIKIQYLPDGRVRYYDIERFARSSGPTRGSSYVTEFNPKTG